MVGLGTSSIELKPTNYPFFSFERDRCRYDWTPGSGKAVKDE